MTSAIAACIRCGLRRRIHSRREAALCSSCSLVGDHHSDETGFLPPGRWVNVKGVRMFVPDRQRLGHIGRPREGQMFRWDDDELRRAHAAYVRRDFDAWSVEGERVYSRRAKQRQTARRQLREAA